MSSPPPNLGARALDFARSRSGLSLVAVLFAVWALSRACGGDAALSYETETPHRGELVVHVTATGTLQPINQVDVGSELSGLIREVHVDFNDVVRKGQVIAQLDTTRLQAQVLQSEAALDSAAAGVEQAKASRLEANAQLARLERVREMSGGKVPSEAELDTARATAARAAAEVASAEAARGQARATLETFRTDLGKTAIRSPIDGIVLKRTVEPGQTVAASLQSPILFTLAEDLTRMELLVSADEADVAAVAEGQKAQFTVDAWPGEAFDAEVVQVRYGADALEGVVTYGVLLRVENPERKLRPGMTATAEIEVQRIPDALLVPNAALRFTPPQAAVEERSPLRMLFMRRPRERASPAGNASSRDQRVYRLRRGEPEPLDVTIGATNGAFTQVLAGELALDDALIVSATTPKS
ncbi:MAG TPA: efflux RND transporter periplasmic adaptor subunit [Myxococcota bacterium]|nr:efflux RND transporter periplasmic adaptor subunit [Myxococcota bacterium]